MVEDDEVAVLEIEAVELVAGLFGVYNILVDNECGALCVVGDALTDLTDSWSAQCRARVGKREWHSPNRTKLAKELKEVVGTDVVVEVLDEKRAVAQSARVVSWAMAGECNAYRFTSGASLPPRLIAWIQGDGVREGG